jgi:mannose-6-phosphate isomerase-like protein (cupin superfamily)
MRADPAVRGVGAELHSSSGAFGIVGWLNSGDRKLGDGRDRQLPSHSARRVALAAIEHHADPECRLPRADRQHGARLWRLPPKSASTLHKHVRQEEFYVVLEGTGRIRIGDETLTVPRYGGVLVGPNLLRQVFNDTDNEVLWLIVGAPEQELMPEQRGDMRLFYPVDPKQLPPELAGVTWPPIGYARAARPRSQA